METKPDQPDIVSQAFCMEQTVSRFSEKARLFYYAVLLSGHACPDCGGGLAMVKEGRCRCLRCRRMFDPTVAFQRCAACGGGLRLLVRRYACTACGIEAVSRFLFAGLVFDAEYFRQKMAEYRERRNELCERVRQMLAESRSAAVPVAPIDLGAVPDLLEAINRLTQGMSPEPNTPPSTAFNLNRYQAHVQVHAGLIPISLEQIPPLGEDIRKDRIWRFIAIIFLAHAGTLDVWQDGQDIMVKQRETDTEGQGVPGDLEEADGIEGAVG